MKKTVRNLLIIGAAALVLLLGGGFVFLCVVVYQDDAFWREQYRDRSIQLLADVEFDPAADYTLVRYGGLSWEAYAMVTDDGLLLENREAFTVHNKGALYGTTPDGEYVLCENGEAVARAPFAAGYSRVDNGTLVFEPTNALQVDLALGAEVAEQGPHHTLLLPRDGSSPCLYAHGEDLADAGGVYRLGYLNRPGGYAAGELEDLPGIIQYTLYGDRGEYNDRHWFYDSATGELSRQFWPIPLREGRRLIYDVGGCIRVSDLFGGYGDEIVLRSEDFPGEGFVREAAFLEGDRLWVRYLDRGGALREKTFDLE